ncbi:MAG: hypothetical protein ACLP59_27120 [Bryobacteraceae bacterium]
MKALFACLAGALVAAIPSMAMAQVAVLQIKVLEGEGAVHPPGMRVARPITVEITDETGRPVAGAAVSFQLPPEGPSGLFSNGLRTDLVLTDAAGRAAIHSMQLNRTGGQLRIRITAVKEQARAGAVAIEYISENRNAVTANTAAATKPAEPAAAAQPAVAAQPEVRVTENTPPAEPANTAKAGEITPTTTKMGSGSHKKWIIAAIVVAGAGIAFLGVSRAKSSSSQTTVSSSVVSVGAPTITVGAP